jgi:hypothetical protein
MKALGLTVFRNGCWRKITIALIDPCRGEAIACSRGRLFISMEVCTIDQRRGPAAR